MRGGTDERASRARVRVGVGVVVLGVVVLGVVVVGGGGVGVGVVGGGVGVGVVGCVGVGVVGVVSSKYLIRAKTGSRLSVCTDSYLYISL